jgi:hypothetical protein
MKYPADNLPALAELGEWKNRPKTKHQPRSTEGRSRDRSEQTHLLKNDPAEKAALRFFAGLSLDSGEFYGLLKRSIVGGP